MSVPVAIIKSWMDFQKLLEEPTDTKIVLYSWSAEYSVKLVLQVFDGKCIYVHIQPEWCDGDFKLAGRKVNLSPLTKAKAKASTFSEAKRIENQWWYKRLNRLLTRLLANYDMMEGQFLSTREEVI